MLVLKLQVNQNVLRILHEDVGPGFPDPQLKGTYYQQFVLPLCNSSLELDFPLSNVNKSNKLSQLFESYHDPVVLNQNRTLLCKLKLEESNFLPNIISIR